MPGRILKKIILIGLQYRFLSKKVYIFIHHSYDYTYTWQTLPIELMPNNFHAHLNPDKREKYLKCLKCAKMPKLPNPAFSGTVYFSWIHPFR